jgi:adenylyl-sulfate kinase
MIIDREPTEQLPSRIVANSEPKSRTLRESQIEAVEREKHYGQKATTLWMTGLVGSGKSSLTESLERKLFDLGAICVVLDGSNVRLGLNRELDFSPEGLSEHLRRVAEMARLLNDSGLMVICAFVSPHAKVRQQVAGIIGPERFAEIHVDASIEWCMEHDHSGLYQRAKTGSVRNVAGVNFPYEPPTQPALRIATAETTPAEAADQVLKMLRERGIFPLMG